MTSPMDLTDWPEERREQLVGSIARTGWLRMRPLLLGLILREVALAELPPTRAELGHRLSDGATDAGEWLDDSCWEREGHRDEGTVAQRAQTDRHAAALGLPPVRTRGHAIDLLVRAGVVREVPDSTGTPRLHPVEPLPTPSDVFHLEADEAEAQRLVRRHAEHERDTFRVISLFDPNGARLTQIETTLELLAHTLDTTPERARQVVLVLLESGDDFSARDDIGAIPRTAPFQLACDWALFAETRVHVL